ncbi:hypothetical protein APSETT444_001492 [Aspergillus pseudonomiae]
MYNASFLPPVESTEEQSKYESRVALALDIDPARTLLNSHHGWPLLESTPAPSSPLYERFSPLVWKDNAWKKAEKDRSYSTTSGILAVGLGHHVYLWSEAFGVQYPPFTDQHPSNYVTSLSFSSESGEKGILAVGRHSGTLSLWSVFDSEIRFEINHPYTITCVAFKHVKSRRISERFQNVEVDTEDLAIGDDSGNIWYYSVEWPDDEILEDFDWQGSMTLIAKISAHTQQPSLLATGGGSNDRAIHFYHTPSGACLATINVYAQVTGLIWSKIRREIVATFGFAQPEHPFRIAVFAWPSCEQIAAIPWGPNGSSWDRIENESNVDCGRALCAVSYPCRPPTYVLDKLDSPDGSSISSLVNQLRSNRKGGSSHYRQAVVRPRAKEGGLWCPRTVEEGCIIVASSDQSVKFHEVWSSGRKQKAAASGPYGGSEILEGIEGLETPGKEVIR